MRIAVLIIAVAMLIGGINPAMANYFGRPREEIIGLEDGDLFDEASKVEMVFIDGEKYTVREEESPKDQETPAGLSEGGQS